MCQGGVGTAGVCGAWARPKVGYRVHWHRLGCVGEGCGWSEHMWCVECVGMDCEGPDAWVGASWQAVVVASRGLHQHCDGHHHTLIVPWPMANQ